MNRARRNSRFGRKEANRVSAGKASIKNVRTPTPTTTSFKVDTWEDYENEEDLASVGRV